MSIVICVAALFLTAVFGMELLSIISLHFQLSTVIYGTKKDILCQNCHVHKLKYIFSRSFPKIDKAILYTANGWTISSETAQCSDG